MCHHSALTQLLRGIFFQGTWQRNCNYLKIPKNIAGRTKDPRGARV